MNPKTHYSNGLLGGKGDQAAIQGDTIRSERGGSRALYMDGVFGAPETAADGVFPPVIGDTGLDTQTVVFGVDARMAWEMLRKVQLAVPVSQLFLAWPGLPETRPVTIWE